jgi:hypothetical protein
VEAKIIEVLATMKTSGPESRAAVESLLVTEVPRYQSVKIILAIFPI